MAAKEHHRKLERLYLAAPINAYYQPTIHITDGAAQVSIAVRPEFYHAARAVHGSVYFKALDDASFFAVNSVVDDVLVLTASFNIYLMRPISDGTLTAEGRLVHRSRRIYLAEAQLLDADGKQIAWGSGSFMRSQIPLNADVGYV